MQRIVLFLLCVFCAALHLDINLEAHYLSSDWISELNGVGSSFVLVDGDARQFNAVTESLLVAFGGAAKSRPITQPCAWTSTWAKARKEIFISSDCAWQLVSPWYDSPEFDVINPNSVIEELHRWPSIDTVLFLVPSSIFNSAMAPNLPQWLRLSHLKLDPAAIDPSDQLRFYDRHRWRPPVDVSTVAITSSDWRSETRRFNSDPSWNVALLSEFLVGQPVAVHALGSIAADLIDASPFKLSSAPPCLVLIGPPGVGKTFVAEVFAHLLPDGAHPSAAFLSFSMQNYRSLEDLDSFVGARQGLVGNGHLFESMQRLGDRRSVLLFDEVGRSHRRLLEFLLQPLSQGSCAVSSIFDQSHSLCSGCCHR